MLVLTRKIGEGIAIGDDVKIIIMQIKGKQVRIGIKASPTTIVHREEIYQKIQEENRSAASPDTTNLQEVEALFNKSADKNNEPKRTPLRRQIRIPRQD